MLLLSSSATGIIFIRKGGGRGGGRSGSLRYALQTNLCFLNYLCQLRFYKLNKSITQVYLEPAGCPGGSVAHLPVHLCAVLGGLWGRSETCVSRCHTPRHARHSGRLAASRRGGRTAVKSPMGKAREGGLSEAGPLPSTVLRSPPWGSHKPRANVAVVVEAPWTEHPFLPNASVALVSIAGIPRGRQEGRNQPPATRRALPKRLRSEAAPSPWMLEAAC